MPGVSAEELEQEEEKLLEELEELELELELAISLTLLERYYVYVLFVVLVLKLEVKVFYMPYHRSAFFLMKRIVTLYIPEFFFV